MRILVDEDIPHAHEAFSPFGAVTAVAPTDFPARVGDADALVVRSTRRVDAALVDGTPVRFVGTATAGIDHVDTAYLASRGITFAAAPGCNAESVAEYVATALLWLHATRAVPLAGRTIGIVGVGQCGSRVARVAAGLGMAPVLCDPPRRREGGDASFRPLAELADCDVVTLHVPHVADGPDRTAGMIDAAFLARLRPDAVLINSCRGDVLDETALLAALDAGRPGVAVIDVWRGEPSFSNALVDRAALATSHIAGYSYDGKVNGTAMMHAALAAFAGVPPSWDATALLRSRPRAVPAADAGDFLALAGRLALDAYPITRDDAALRTVRAGAASDQARGFRDLRRHYPLRREFGSVRVHLARPAPDAAARLRAIGFQVVDAAQ